MIQSMPTSRICDRSRPDNRLNDDYGGEEEQKPENASVDARDKTEAGRCGIRGR